MVKKSVLDSHSAGETRGAPADPAGTAAGVEATTGGWGAAWARAEGAMVTATASFPLRAGGEGLALAEAAAA